MGKFPGGEIFRAFFGRRPRRRFGYFAAAGKVTRPAGRNIPVPRSIRRRSVQVRRFLPVFWIPGKGKGRALALHHMGFRFHGQRNENLLMSQRKAASS